MSDLLIKGVETPRSCGNCFFDTHCDNCRLRNWGAPPPDDCPLAPVPPHGRLIDADALVEDMKRQCEEVFKIDAVSPDDFWIKRDKAYNERLWKTWCESFFEYLKARETIIEAERE